MTNATTTSTAAESYHARNTAKTYRAAVVGECPLTTREEGYDLDDEALLDAAMAEAAKAGLDIERSDIRITTWTEL